MPFQQFHELFPEIGMAETRSIAVLTDDGESGLPPGDYGFCEMFCNERGCDCRRVFFYVMASFSDEPQAVIAWGWEPREFYAKWLHGDDDPAVLDELVGPCLNLGSSATELAPGILRLVCNVLLADEEYVERVKRHYWLFRARVDGKSSTSSRKRRMRMRKRKG